MKVLLAVSASLLFGLLGFAQVVAEKPKSSQSLLEKKLHGEWQGDPCMGDWTFWADGTFALKNYSPGGNNFTGTWKVRWDALPATLVLTFSTSDAPGHFKVGQTWELKLVQLDDKAFTYTEPQNPDQPSSCQRARK
jgi:hypothetical protein